MNTVEYVKKLCAERGIAVSKLERDLGFSNGYLRSLKSGRFPYERAKVIGDYLGVSPEFLATGVQTGNEGWYISEETAKVAQELFEDPDLRVLFDAAKDSRPEDIRLAAEMLKRFKESNPNG